MPYLPLSLFFCLLGERRPASRLSKLLPSPLEGRGGKSHEAGTIYATRLAVAGDETTSSCVFLLIFVLPQLIIYADVLFGVLIENLVAAVLVLI